MRQRRRLFEDRGRDGNHKATGTLEPPGAGRVKEGSFPEHGSRNSLISDVWLPDL